MDGLRVFKIPQEMKYSDIIVPTMDLVRGSFIIEKLLVNHKKVSETAIKIITNHIPADFS
jgi:hypothetical protein